MGRVSDIPKTMIHRILSEYLMKKKVAACWVLHRQFSVQKQHHMELCQKHLTHKRKVIVFLKRIIVSDEIWVCEFELELTSQSEIFKGKNSPRLQKF